jgi:hypothetical protein
VAREAGISDTLGYHEYTDQDDLVRRLAISTRSRCNFCSSSTTMIQERVRAGLARARDEGTEKAIRVALSKGRRRYAQNRRSLPPVRCSGSQKLIDRRTDAPGARVAHHQIQTSILRPPRHAPAAAGPPSSPTLKTYPYALTHSNATGRERADAIGDIRAETSCLDGSRPASEMCKSVAARFAAPPIPLVLPVARVRQGWAIGHLHGAPRAR